MLKGTQAAQSNYLIKQLPRATAFINSDFELVHVSDRWIRDFDLGQQQSIGQTLFEVFGVLAPEQEAVIQTCLAGKGSESCRFRRTGTERFFQWDCIPWYDDAENIIGVIIQSEEITTHLLSQARLEKVELLLEEKSEIGKIGSWEYDAQTEALHWCPMTKRIHGVPPSFVPHLEGAIEYYKEGYSRNTISMAVFKALEQGISWSEKLQLITAQGKEIWVISAGKPLYRDGILQGLIGTFQDITDHVRSEIKTRESEMLLRTVVDNLPLNVYIKDLESRKILVNQWEANFLGFSNPEDVLGKSDFDLYDPKMARIFREEDLSVLNSLVPILSKESLNVKPDGTTTTFLSSKIPLVGTDGKAYGLLGISLDISNLKQQESELRDLINVTSLQNKKLINFAHIVSHNLRSHTANFSMLLDFLRTETDESEKQKIMSMLSTASDKLQDTLENLNEVVSINTNISQKKQALNLNERIRSVSQSLASFLRDHHATLVNEIPEDTVIQGVPAYLDSILMNFFTNAVKYRDPQRPPVITLSTFRTENYTVLSIADNGLGIDLQRHGDKLFGMYKTFHDIPGARGIGLYITKNQVEAMNGKIMVSSEEGKGSTFNIYFNEKN